MTMPIMKDDVLVKAKNHLIFFSEARNETALLKLYNGAFGHGQSLWKIGLITEEELLYLKGEAESARVERFHCNSSSYENL
jgi:hypothetical protein